jgi:hypothetical protein
VIRALQGLGRSGVRATALIAFVTTVMAACGSDGPARGAETSHGSPPVVRIVAGDFYFRAPQQEIRGGKVRLALDNEGKSVHIGSLVRIDRGKTATDVVSLVRSFTSGHDSGPQAWFHETDVAFAPVGPGHRPALVTDLIPGTYAMFCLLTTPDGKPHALQGMVGSFTVVGTDRSRSPEPVGTIRIDDKRFKTTPLPAGRNVFALRNDGTRPHEFAFVKFKTGKTMADGDEFIRGGQATPSPAEFAGGQVVAPGKTQLLELELTPGEWTVADVGAKTITGTVTVR